MSQAENPDPLKDLFKAITNIIGYAAAMVSYFLALSGRLPGQAPVTTSIATILITSLFVVSWRWRAIARVKGSSSGGVLTIPAGVHTPEEPPLHGLLDPIKRFSRKNYIYSLRRRRVESGILLGVIVLSVGWTGFRFQAALREFGNPLLSCSTEGEEDLRVLIADIQATGNGSGLLVEDRLYDFLNDYPGGQFQVCRWREAIPVRTRAKEVATSNRADMLIWGRKDVAIYEIHLEVPAWESLNRTLSKASSKEATSADFQLTEDEHLGYVTEFALSEMIFLSGDSELAQERLQTALNQAKGAAFASAHPNDLAKGYFLLGLFYDPYTETRQADSQKSIQAYSEALTWQGDLYAAALNRGVLRSDDGDIEGAQADYTLLIEKDTPLKGSAYVNRAFLLLMSDPQAAERDLDNAINLVSGDDKVEGYFFRGQLRMWREDYQGAIADLEQAVALDPQGYYNHHMLGMAHLYAGEIAAARETYREIIPTLDDGKRQQVLKELEQIAAASPELKAAIDEISAELRAANLPETSP